MLQQYIGLILNDLLLKLKESVYEILSLHYGHIVQVRKQIIMSSTKY